MKRKLLLLGNKLVMAEFFIHMREHFMCLSSTNLQLDVENHLTVFEPDGIIYCMGKQVVQEVEQLKLLSENLEFSKRSLILIGDSMECDMACKLAPGMFSYVIKRPIAPKKLEDQISAFINTKIAMKKETPAERVLQSMTDGQKMTAAQKDILAAGGNTPTIKEEISLTKIESRKQILVVDDDKVVLKLVKSCLEPDYEVTAVLSGKMALKFLQLRTVDLILLDYEMPDITGVDIYKLIKVKKDLREVPVVFLTGLADRARIQEVLALEPSGYMMKPLDIEKLKETIQKLLGK